MRLLSAVSTLFLIMASQATSAPLPGELAGLNIISGQSGASTIVRLATAATIATPFGPSPSVKTSGSEAAGFALVLQGDEPFVAFGGKLPKEAGGSTFALPLTNVVGMPSWNYDFAKNYEDKLKLPPGTYRLILWGEQDQVRLVLRLDGLSGRTSIHPSRLVRSEVNRPQPRLDVSGSVYSAGSWNAVTTDGVLFNALWIGARAFAAGQFGFCHYTSEDLADAAFLPGCPNADDQGFSNNRRVETTEHTRVLFQGTPAGAAGTHGQGAWWATEAVVEEAGYLSVWIGLTN